jgi:hypothetical protein
MAERRNAGTRAVGEALVHIVPKLLTALSAIGTAAMLWVGGGILVHGLEELKIVATIPDTIHDVAGAAAEASGVLGPLVEWLVGAVGSAIIGALIGGIIVAIVRRFTKHPEDLIVD